jgi:hypothetical protein
VTLALIALAVLAVLIFAFVLEPVVRARGDQTLLDAAALPEHDEPLDDEDEIVEPAIKEPSAEIDGDERLSGRRVSIDRPAGSDAS